MKLFKRIVAVMLTVILVFLSTSESFHALVEAASSTKTTMIQNDFIKVTVDNETGRYGIRTVEGQPIRKNDNNVNLLFQGMTRKRRSRRSGSTERIIFTAINTSSMPAIIQRLLHPR